MRVVRVRKVGRVEMREGMEVVMGWEKGCFDILGERG